MSLSPSDFHPVIDITIYMNVHVPNPGPQWSCFEFTQPNSTDYKVLYLNEHSLKAFVTLDGSPTNVCKITLFQELAHSEIYDVISVWETCLNDSVMDSIFRKDRVERVEGGILVVGKSLWFCGTSLDVKNHSKGSMCLSTSGNYTQLEILIGNS